MNTEMTRHAIVGACVLLLASVPAPNQSGSGPAKESLIHVDIAGFHSNDGQALCALFSSADGFPKRGERAMARARSAIVHEHAACEFSAIAPGRYAISVFHGENSNGKLDTNFVGMPREGVGAGPPKFDAAAFSFRGGRLDLKISITYLLERH